MSDDRDTGTIRVSLRNEDNDQETKCREEIPRIVRLLALAHRWHRLVDDGTVESQAEIARMTGLTRARVTQIMDLRWLCPVFHDKLVGSRVGDSINDMTCSPSAGTELLWRAQTMIRR